MSFTVSRRLPRSAFWKIIVKELVCYPCVRTTVTYVSSPNTIGGGENYGRLLRLAMNQEKLKLAAGWMEVE